MNDQAAHESDLTKAHKALRRNHIRPQEIQNAVHLAVYAFRPFEGGRTIIQALKDPEKSKQGFPRFYVAGQLQDSPKYYETIYQIYPLAGMTSGTGIATGSIDRLCESFTDQKLGLTDDMVPYPKLILERLGIDNERTIKALEEVMDAAFAKHVELAKTRSGRG